VWPEEEEVVVLAGDLVFEEVEASQGPAEEAEDAQMRQGIFEVQRSLEEAAQQTFGGKGVGLLEP